MRLPRAVVLVAMAVGWAGGGGACSSEVTIDAAVVVPPRTVSFTWKVIDLNGAELACDQIDAQLVTVTFFQSGTGQGFTDVFDCFRKAGTRVLDEGEYSIGFELGDRSGTLARLPTRRYQVTGDAALDEAAFPVDPFGDLALTLDTGQPASCGGSSAITAMTIEVYRADGTCEPAALTIEPATPYLVNCVTPSLAGCIEKDQRVIGTRLPAGDYRIRAIALQGATPCWEYDQHQRVRAAGLGRAAVLSMTKTCN